MASAPFMQLKIRPRRALLALTAAAIAGATLSPKNAHAATSSRGHSIDLGAGLTSQNAYRTASDDTGGKSLLGTTYVHFRLATALNIGTSWGLVPAVSYTPFGAKGADSGEKSKLLMADLQLFKSNGRFEIRTGPGVLYNSLSGSGGTTTLNNGGSSAVFGLPSTTTTTRVFYWSVGAGLSLFDYRMDLDVLVTGPMTSRRAFNPMITLSRGFF
jgi:hypothetical protein